jgi:hypothetical protein
MREGALLLQLKLGGRAFADNSPPRCGFREGRRQEDRLRWRLAHRAFDAAGLTNVWITHPYEVSGPNA